MTDTTNIPAFNIFDWIRDGVPNSFLEAAGIYDGFIPAATRNKPIQRTSVAMRDGSEQTFRDCRRKERPHDE